MSTTQPGPDGSIQPHPDATRLANRLLDATEVHKTILAETVNGGEVNESGRTVCPPDGEFLDPIHRFTENITLKACPRGGGGLIHTHVRPDELRNPTHSVPDIGNVLLEGGELVSVVLGTETSSVWFAPEDREAGVRVLNDALETDGSVRTPEDLYEMIEAGQLPIPRGEARDRLHDRLPSLYYRAQTNYPSFYSQLGDIDPAQVQAAEPCMAVHHAIEADEGGSEAEQHAAGTEATAGGGGGHHGHRDGHEHGHDPLHGTGNMNCHDALVRRAHGGKYAYLAATQGISVREVAAGQIIGSIVGKVVNHVLFKTT